MSGASKRVSGASKQVNRRASGPVLTSGFLIILDLSAGSEKVEEEPEETKRETGYGRGGNKKGNRDLRVTGSALEWKR